ncbi:hypothetical protein F966_03639 [Acinetobacter higginsii]|uniref:Methyltransferase n=1 Tax=Acinetobacter higginsii TaxID=70347 RepID=N8W6W5_9GAMM|nr:hypothetical protein [Acinetobacter higginsii]ENV07782.1 hypothetical protein F966_03639 [Acinetobacter higginsii]
MNTKVLDPCCGSRMMWFDRENPLSATTIRDKLVAINQGTGGKHMYNPELAHQILTRNESNKRGRKRAN